MGFGFKQPLVGEKRCVTTLITAAEETIPSGATEQILYNTLAKLCKLGFRQK